MAKFGVNFALGLVLEAESEEEVKKIIAEAIGTYNNKTTVNLDYVRSYSIFNTK